MQNGMYEFRCVVHLTVISGVGSRLWRQGLTTIVQPGNHPRLSKTGNDSKRTEIVNVQTELLKGMQYPMTT